jgi:subtilisin family serine protease
MDGTSMAAPHVAGLASLAWSYRPDLSNTDIKKAILDNGDSTSSLV